MEFDSPGGRAVLLEYIEEKRSELSGVFEPVAPAVAELEERSEGEAVEAVVDEHAEARAHEPTNLTGQLLAQRFSEQLDPSPTVNPRGNFNERFDLRRSTDPRIPRAQLLISGQVVGLTEDTEDTSPTTLAELALSAKTVNFSICFPDFETFPRASLHSESGSEMLHLRDNRLIAHIRGKLGDQAVEHIEDAIREAAEVAGFEILPPRPSV